MKTTLQGNIIKIEKKDGLAYLTLSTRGKVSTGNIATQEALMEGELILKSLVANQMKIGAVITIAISDEEEVR